MQEDTILSSWAFAGHWNHRALNLPVARGDWREQAEAEWVRLVPLGVAAGGSISRPSSKGIKMQQPTSQQILYCTCAAAQPHCPSNKDSSFCKVGDALKLLAAGLTDTFSPTAARLSPKQCKADEARANGRGGDDTSHQLQVMPAPCNMTRASGWP